jgi:hypothetical protein
MPIIIKLRLSLDKIADFSGFSSRKFYPAVITPPRLWQYYKTLSKKSQNRASRVIKYKNAPCEIDPRSYL